MTSHTCHGQVDGPAEREIAAQLNRASVEILKSDMGDLTGDGLLEYAAAVDKDILLLLFFLVGRREAHSFRSALYF